MDNNDMIMKYNPMTGERIVPEESETSKPAETEETKIAAEWKDETATDWEAKSESAEKVEEVNREASSVKTEDKWADVYAESSGKKQKAKKERKAKQGGGFFKKALAAVVLAIIFGAVAGGTFYGICRYTGIFDQNTTVTVPVAWDNTEKKEGTSEPKTELTQSSGNQEVKMVNSDNIQLITTDMSEMVQEVIPAMVTILNTGEPEYDFWGRTYTPQSGGTGVIIGENETELLIVTNHHVAVDAKQLDITFVDNTVVQARVKGMDSDMDLAVLSVALKDISEETKSKIAIAKIGDSNSLKLGQPAVVIGNALGYGISVTDGVISALNREMTTEDGNVGTFIQTDAAVNHGNSGGALVNVKGELIGIVSSKLQGESVEGMGYAIPISEASPIIQELMEYQTRTEIVAAEEQGYLGVNLQRVTDEARAYYGLPEGGYVYYVAEDSGAAKAGLKKGDVVTKIEKQKVTSNADAREILQYYHIGEEVTICYSRLEDGEYVSHEATVVLGAAQSK
ncbi:MAG: trypsin-like peptidase domain-containing protein [Lachnospiraceae bacterium]|nr:trypsin-like peptidase domain-containing protein [Lachnospiraceae bacterium]